MTTSSLATHLFNLVAQNVLDQAAQGLKAGFQLLLGRFLLLCLLQGQTLLGAAGQLLPIILLELHSTVISRSEKGLGDYGAET